MKETFEQLEVFITLQFLFSAPF